MVRSTAFSPVLAAASLTLCGLAVMKAACCGEQLITAQPAAAPKATVRVLGATSPRIGMFSGGSTLQKSMFLFSNRQYKAQATIPAFLYGRHFHELDIDQAYQYECAAAGEILALAPVNEKVDRTLQLERLGFERVDGLETFPLFGENPADVVGVFRKHLSAGETIRPPVWTVIAGFEVERAPRQGELLYNGIRLPSEWPPIIGWNSEEPVTPPYLEHPPKLIPIDVGRQLFVDDFLIEETDMQREYHYPQKYADNPVLRPETEIERGGRNNLAVACPKSGGLWWSPEKQRFELWYEAGWVTTIAYATSKDGLSWERPNLPLNKGTNQVLPSQVKPDSWTVVRDYRTTDVDQKFKVFLRGGGDSRGRARAFVTPDGLDWGQRQECGLCGDRSTMFYNAFRKKWIYSLRWDSPGGRSRAYWESDDFLQGMQWLPDDPVPWACTDKLDLPDPRIGDQPQLYNLDAVPYESVLLGFFQVLHGPPNDVNAAKGLPKNTGLNFAYSRDGFHWHRPDRTMAINSEQRAVWDRGYVQSLGNLCTVRGDQLWFYFIGFAGDEKVKLGQGGVTSSMSSGLYANGATGVAFLRRDGFVSLNTAATPGLITTRPVTFSGKYLFANVDAPGGALRAEVLDMAGQAIEPFTLEKCLPVRGDTTLSPLRWRGGDDLSKLAYRPVRFRFQLENGKLYSFWVSRDESGRSDGYVAGGGPGFTCDVDTVGKGAIQAEAELMGVVATRGTK